MGIQYTYIDPSGIRVTGAYARMNQWSSTADEGDGVGQAYLLTYVSTADYSAGRTPIRQTNVNFGLDAVMVLPVVEGTREVIDAICLTMPDVYPDAVIVPDPPPVGSTAAEGLEMVRSRYLAAVIGERNRRLNSVGFEYPPGSGKVFPIGPETEARWVGLFAMADVLTAQGAYPFTVRTWDDRDSYDLVDATDARTMAATGLGAFAAARSIAGAVKDAVVAATDVAGIQAAASAYLAGG